MAVNHKFEMPVLKDVNFDSCGSVIGALMENEIEDAISIMENEAVSFAELYVFIHDEGRVDAFGEKNKDAEVRLYAMLADYVFMVCAKYTKW